MLYSSKGTETTSGVMTMFDVTFVEFIVYIAVGVAAFLPVMPVVLLLLLMHTSVDQWMIDSLRKVIRDIGRVTVDILNFAVNVMTRLNVRPWEKKDKIELPPIIRIK